MRKRLAIVITAFLCVIGVMGYSPAVTFAAVDTSEVAITGDVDDQDTYQEYIEQYVDAWASMDFASYLDTYGSELETEDYDRYSAWGELQSQLGEVQSILSENFEEDENGLNIVAVVSFENGKAQFTIAGDLSSDYTVDVAEYVEEKVPLGELMSKAGLNTIMSICIVFVVLVFIACIISLFKFIPMLFGPKEKKEIAEEAPVAVPAPVVEDVTDDTELVAVITAAIMASMGDEAPADGLRISSIRRVNSKWKRS